MTKAHYAILAALAALCIFTGCTTESKARIYHDGKTVGRVIYGIALDEFNTWLNEQ